MSFELLSPLVFLAAALAGYRLIGQVPSLLHTPLMSGMNALSGITVLAAVAATAGAAATGSRLLGFVGIVCATVNVVAGFAVTDRMLRMFKKTGEGGEGK